MSDFWHKQGAKPLFEDLLWSKPENKNQAGKLLIIGGNAHSFVAPANAYNESLRAGIGSAKVLLPDALKKTIGPVLEKADFTPSTKSGSFAKTALAEWIDHAAWADGVLLAGDFGHNSETAVMLEQFVAKYSENIVITHDGLEYFLTMPLKLLERENTTITASLAQLQKICTNAKLQQAVTYDMTIIQMTELLHVLTTMYPVRIILKHNNVFFVAVDGEVSTTKTDDEVNIWRVQAAAHASVWLLQNPSAAFRALTTSVFELTTQSA